MDLRKGLRADLSRMIAMRCKKSASDISDLNVSATYLLGHDANDQVFINQAKHLADNLELEAAGIRKDIARILVTNDEKLG